MKVPPTEVGGILIPLLLTARGESEVPPTKVGGILIPLLLTARGESEVPPTEVGGILISGLERDVSVFAWWVCVALVFE